MTVEYIVLVSVVMPVCMLHSLFLPLSLVIYTGVTQSLTRLSPSGTPGMHTLPDPHFDNLYAHTVNKLT